MSYKQFYYFDFVENEIEWLLVTEVAVAVAASVVERVAVELRANRKKQNLS